MATVFKTAELGVNRPVGGFDSHTLPLFIFGLQETRPRLLKVLNVQSERKKLTESIWFWIYLFSTAGLIGLVILQGKFDTRQDLEEINFRARMQTYGEGTATSFTTKTSPNEQIVTLTPLYILFGLAFTVSWIALWKQRILRKPSQTSSENLTRHHHDPPLSEER